MCDGVSAVQEEAVFDSLFAHFIIKFLKAHIRALVIHYDRLSELKLA